MQLTPSHGHVVRFLPDVLGVAPLPRMIDRLYYGLTADPEEERLILESATPEEIHAYYVPGGEMILEALEIARFSQSAVRIEKLVRVLNRYGKEGEPAAEVPTTELKVRKDVLFATATASIPFSDGQTLHIVFHAPDDDPKKINPDDKLIAFRWILNKRDITQVVSPEKGKDIEVADLCKRIMRLVAKNSEKFASAQAEVTAQRAAVDDVKAQVDTTVTQMLETINATAGAKSDLEKVNLRIGNTENRIERISDEIDTLQDTLDNLKAAAASTGSGEPKPIGVKTPEEQAAEQAKAEGDEILRLYIQGLESRGFAQSDGKWVKGDLSSSIPTPPPGAIYVAGKAGGKGFSYKLAKGLATATTKALAWLDKATPVADPKPGYRLSDGEQSAWAESRPGFAKDQLSIESVGGYAGIKADPERQKLWQDMLDGVFQSRISKVRGALRDLGWDGESNGTLSKNGQALKFEFDQVGGGGNVVGMTIGGIEDTMQQTAAALAAEIDAAFGMGNTDAKTFDSGQTVYMEDIADKTKRIPVNYRGKIDAEKSVVVWDGRQMAVETVRLFADDLPQPKGERLDNEVPKNTNDGDENAKALAATGQEGTNIARAYFRVQAQADITIEDALQIRKAFAGEDGYDRLSSLDGKASIASLTSTIIAMGLGRSPEGTAPEPQIPENTPEAVAVAHEVLSGKFDHLPPDEMADLVDAIFDLDEALYGDLMEQVDAHTTALTKQAAMAM